ncbi:MAG TPA: DUF3450 domain-containing protein [Desulfocapsa sulfexigens]|nr:DUF3450 domain-containing protein [Desulfocapsa sulfexigens]
MFRIKKQYQAAIIVCLFLVLITQIAHAATEVDQVQKNVDVAIDTLQETQKQEDGWADEEASLTAKLKEKRQQQELLTKQQERLRKQIKLMQERVMESKRRVAEVERIRLEMGGFLEETFLRLQEQINSEFLPFLTDERQGRVKRLEELLLDDTVSTAEKFRRIMEALQIEADYGRAMEVVREPVLLGQDSLVMDVLRIGRLSLFSRTPDGTRIAVFDQATGSWQPLPESYGRSLRQAIEVANKTRPVEIVHLPLGRINGSSRTGGTQ